MTEEARERTGEGRRRERIMRVESLYRSVILTHLFNTFEVIFLNLADTSHSKYQFVKEVNLQGQVLRSAASRVQEVNLQGPVLRSAASRVQGVNLQGPVLRSAASRVQEVNLQGQVLRTGASRVPEEWSQQGERPLVTWTHCTALHCTAGGNFQSLGSGRM